MNFMLRSKSVLKKLQGELPLFYGYINRHHPRLMAKDISPPPSGMVGGGAVFFKYELSWPYSAKGQGNGGALITSFKRDCGDPLEILAEVKNNGGMGFF